MGCRVPGDKTAQEKKRKILFSLILTAQQVEAVEKEKLFLTERIRLCSLPFCPSIAGPFFQSSRLQ